MPSRLSGITGQDQQRLQSGGAQVPLGTDAPIDLLGEGSSQPTSPVAPSPSTLPDPSLSPGTGEGVTTTPPGLEPMNQELHPTTSLLLDAATQGDPEAISIIDELIRTMEQFTQ